MRLLIWHLDWTLTIWTSESTMKWIDISAVRINHDLIQKQFSFLCNQSNALLLAPFSFLFKLILKLLICFPFVLFWLIIWLKEFSTIQSVLLAARIVVIEFCVSCFSLYFSNLELVCQKLIGKCLIKQVIGGWDFLLLF